MKGSNHGCFLFFYTNSVVRIEILKVIWLADNPISKCNKGKAENDTCSDVADEV